MRKLILRKEIYIQSKHNVAMLQGTMPTSPSAGSLSLLVARDTGSHIVSKKEVNKHSCTLQSFVQVHYWLDPLNAIGASL